MRKCKSKNALTTECCLAEGKVPNKGTVVLIMMHLRMPGNFFTVTLKPALEEDIPRIKNNMVDSQMS